ncbi:hypothetical protein [Burkholderia pseudomallei]|uniref:hypothetical protein n=1 Tax=Burkholderia pseudomallei TaxID=28450 RepID=UPI0003D945FD|nr:hypothetical protein [Burkholderia pseudomallei]AHE29199.1 hypothetical protein BBJ_4046 [Burkholderia pseudomallei NCTC 13178]KGC47188.1 hypothetical protein DO65_807 [Burkholderia pseudomallei]
MNLDEKLMKLASSLDPPERVCLKILLAASAAELMKQQRNEDGPNTAVIHALLRSVWRTAPMIAGRKSGIAYCGRPPWLSEEILVRLQNESLQMRAEAARFHDHLVASNGTMASQVATSGEMKRFIQDYVGNFIPSGKANYLYYDAPGMGIEPHVDTDDFGLNAVMLLEHQYQSDPSSLVIFEHDGSRQVIRLTPGEMIVFFASSVVHAREFIKAGEIVRIVAFGFELGTSHDSNAPVTLNR